MSGMDMAEVRQRVIGLLTLAYETAPGTEEAPQSFLDAVRSLWEGMGDYSTTVSLPAGREEIERYARDISIHMSKEITALVSEFVGMFYGLCLKIEQRFPDEDIRGLVREFLQEQGREAANG